MGMTVKIRMAIGVAIQLLFFPVWGLLAHDL
jgi:hypothetical protein